MRTGLVVIVTYLALHPSFSEAETPIVFLLDATHLAELRQQISATPDSFDIPIKEIRREAEDVLSKGPWSVMDKTHIAPSGDKHDYLSVGPYWWPDPSKPDGLPYIRRDGEVNPERHEYDSSGLKNTVSAVQRLAKGWYFTREPKFAERATLLLRTWFLDPATRMNPNLQYGQAIPGRTEGRGIGIIDTAQLASLVDAVGLLQSSPAWSDTDHRELQQWFAAYLDWLLTSKHGKDEANTKNNHAVWYDVQVASFALFVGDKATARQVLEKVGPRRIATQIEPDGRMPHELARTNSFSYTKMNLQGFLHLARLGEHVDVDLWRYRSDDGRSVEAALDWLEPFVAGRAKWQYKQISSLDTSTATMLYRQASRKFDKPAYRKLGATIADPVDCLVWPEV